MTKSRYDGEELRLVFRPLNDPRPIAIRTRLLLKYALRACGFRCLTVEALPPERTEKEP